jgi:hypothetical protein
MSRLAFEMLGLALIGLIGLLLWTLCSAILLPTEIT